MVVNNKEAILMHDLLNEISELKKQIDRLMEINDIVNYFGKYPHVFNPNPIMDKAKLTENIHTVMCIHNILGEHGINIKSKGYSYILDAVCLMCDFGSTDICLDKEVYPIIAKKYKIKGTGLIEHNIRNAIGAAYNNKSNSNQKNEVWGFDTKPGNKLFLLHVMTKVNEMILQEAYI